jgi:hypothetical protein
MNQSVGPTAVPREKTKIKGKKRKRNPLLGNYG